MTTDPATADPATSNPPRPATCPSSSCEPGHLLIGIVRPDGTTAGVWPPLPIDEAFVASARAADRVPEARLRFAGPCVTSQCHQWHGDRCRIGDLVAGQPQAAVGPGAAAAPPPCAIRATCRWWSQNGVAACRSCPKVVHTRADQPDGRVADDPRG
ncbi:hypothetical protein [Pseudofrankia inefficax]|uniref:Uncharacterized protein n=1 Tax=Pseudofrankia inefficax (strain DSM 45817 / CECT 9037 / DDB 130130 / EuI1c) TaxID=298654 RepID=E3IY41_PSEI1|nr:hypothetical protein [Pseudofrankia inefficax]ADP82639.1 hypothetical protein FraEuI1c_4646 [Pseudofrankia inefficax]